MAVSEAHSRTGSRLDLTGNQLLPMRPCKLQASPFRTARKSRMAPVSTRALSVSWSMALRIQRLSLLLAWLIALKVYRTSDELLSLFWLQGAVLHEPR